MYCVICRSEMPFEQPPDGDGSEACGTEWVCTACGAALAIVAIVDRTAA